MTELDQVWSRLLHDAAVKAGDSGRHDVVDYLRLKASNDLIRTTGVDWLLATMIDIAGSVAEDHHGLTIEREEPHNFARGNSNMVGCRLDIRQGVRCLSIEAGWARTPNDGIMQNGALAFSRISHFGMPELGADLRLIHSGTLPNWLSDDGLIIDSGYLEHHFKLLTR